MMMNPTQSQAKKYMLLITFLSFIYLSFVGLVPFADRVVLELEDTGNGVLIKQIAYVLIAMIFILKMDKVAWEKTLQAISIPMVMALAWAGLSLFWSPVPDIAFRRLVLTVLIIFTVFSAVNLLGSETVIKTTFYGMLALIVVSLAAGLFVPNAIHQASDPNGADLVGNWRGVFIHKNTAGLVAAMLIMYGLFLFRQQSAKIWLAGVSLGGMLLFLSVSKTSMGLLFPSIMAGIAFVKYSESGNKKLFNIIILSMLCSVMVLIFVFQDQIVNILNDPTSFTGRADIWSMLLLVIQDHIWLGVGYGSVYGVGPATPLFQYASGWVLLIPSGHNGYLDVIASLGIIGMALVLVAFIIQPWSKLVGSKIENFPYAGLYMATIVFLLLHNFTESSLFDRDRTAWVAFLIPIAIIQHAYHSSKKSLSV